MAKRGPLAASTTVSLGVPAFCLAADDDARWVHPLCQPLPIDRNSRLVELAGVSLMTIGREGTPTSAAPSTPEERLQTAWQEAVYRGLERLNPADIHARVLGWRLPQEPATPRR